MNFLNTSAFWFALTLPVVVVFYLLKRKRKVQVVASSMLWRKFLAETQELEKTLLICNTVYWRARRLDIIQDKASNRNLQHNLLKETS